MDVKIRRLENNLTTLGTGVIAFGMWSFIKITLTNLMMGKQFSDTVESDYVLISNIIAFVFILVIFLIYLWIGLSARAEGKGKHKRICYLIMVGFIIFISILLLGAEVYAVFTLKEKIFTFIITMIVDVTRTIFLIDLMRSSITLRKLKKQQLLKEGNTDES